MMNDRPQMPATRRSFLKRSTVAGGSALAGFSILRAGYGANRDTIRIGVIGVGGRGRGAIGNVLSLETNAEVVAIADISQDSIDTAVSTLKEHTENGKPLVGFNVAPERCYVGLEAYKRLCDDADIDIVFLTTPPAFRPLHFEYAVKAGKHVFAEKPAATDPVGVRRIMNAAQLAKQKGLGVLAGTQRRHQPSYIETIRRVHDGQIGDIISGHVYWNGNGSWGRERKPGMSDRDYWLYNWYKVDFLCGDHIVEQHLHNLDVANWVMGGHPVKAYGMGGIQFWTDRPGNIYDHFCVEYEYSGGRRVTSMCRQISGTDGKVAEEFMGTQGSSSTVAWGNIPCQITGRLPWHYDAPDKERGPYEQEHQDFIDSIRRGQPFNEAQQLAESTMTAVMGRESAYTGKVITWDDMMQSSLALAPADLTTWDGTLRPVPKPGMKRG